MSLLIADINNRSVYLVEEHQLPYILSAMGTFTESLRSFYNDPNNVACIAVDTSCSIPKRIKEFYDNLNKPTKFKISNNEGGFISACVYEGLQMRVDCDDNHFHSLLEAVRPIPAIEKIKNSHTVVVENQRMMVSKLYDSDPLIRFVKLYVEYASGIKKPEKPPIELTIWDYMQIVSYVGLGIFVLMFLIIELFIKE